MKLVLAEHLLGHLKNKKQGELNLKILKFLI